MFNINFKTVFQKQLIFFTFKVVPANRDMRRKSRKIGLYLEVLVDLNVALRGWMLFIRELSSCRWVVAIRIHSYTSPIYKHHSLIQTNFPLKKYRRHDRRYQVDSGRHICRPSGRQLLRKHVCMTGFLPTPFLLCFCLPVCIRPASLPLLACFNSTPTYSNTDLGRSRD